MDTEKKGPNGPGARSAENTGPFLRIITADQLAAGYATFAGGQIVRHRYAVVEARADRTFVVREPEYDQLG